MHFVCLRPGLCLQLPLHAPLRPRCRTVTYDAGRTPGVTPTSSAVAVRLGVPVIKVSKGLSPPSHFPVGFRLPVLTPTSASAPCPAHSSSPGQFPSQGPPQIRTRRFPPSGSSVEFDLWSCLPELYVNRRPWQRVTLQQFVELVPGLARSLAPSVQPLEPNHRACPKHVP